MMSTHPIEVIEVTTHPIEVIEVGNVGGAPGPAGPPGDPGIVMSPDPPPTTDVLWADTDEEGSSGGGGGVSAVFAHYSSFFGVSGAKNTSFAISYNNPAHGTASALPAGWVLSADGTNVGVSRGVYSFHLSWNAPDQYWYAEVQGSFLYGSDTNAVKFSPCAPVASGANWVGAVSGTAVLHNDTQQTNVLLPGHTGPWFVAILYHAAAATATNSVKWALNVTRLGDIPT
jgi:hypothetical protein